MDSGRMATASNKQAHNRSKSDIVLYVLSAMLLLTLGLASVYGFKYGKVDESVLPGRMSLYEDGDNVLWVEINEDMTARVGYLGFELEGTFRLAGAETDTVLYQLRGIERVDGEETTDEIIFFRMPRTGMQGDFSGAWAIYYARPSEGEMCSDWVIAEDDGTAFAARKANYNAVTAQRSQLKALSDSWKWAKTGDELILES